MAFETSTKANQYFIEKNKILHISHLFDWNALISFYMIFKLGIMLQRCHPTVTYILVTRYKFLLALCMSNTRLHFTIRVNISTGGTWHPWDLNTSHCCVCMNRKWWNQVMKFMYIPFNDGSLQWRAVCKQVCHVTMLVSW